MKPTIAIALVAICGLMSSAALAAEKQARCKFTVEGKTYLNGRCNFEADPDGSFRIWDDVHTVYVDVDGNTAQATWNKNPKSFHADSPLGTLTKNGGCWQNAKTQICVRK